MGAPAIREILIWAGAENDFGSAPEWSCAELRGEKHQIQRMNESEASSFRPEVAEQVHRWYWSPAVGAQLRLTCARFAESLLSHATAYLRDLLVLHLMHERSPERSAHTGTICIDPCNAIGYPELRVFHSLSKRNSVCKWLILGTWWSVLQCRKVRMATCCVYDARCWVSWLPYVEGGISS